MRFFILPPAFELEVLTTVCFRVLCQVSLQVDSLAGDLRSGVSLSDSGPEDGLGPLPSRGGRRSVRGPSRGVVAARGGVAPYSSPSMQAPGGIPQYNLVLPFVLCFPCLICQEWMLSFPSLQAFVLRASANYKKNALEDIWDILDSQVQGSNCCGRKISVDTARSRWETGGSKEA